MVCFAAFGHAASGHMIPAVSLKRMAGEAAFRPTPVVHPLDRAKRLLSRRNDIRARPGFMVFLRAVLGIHGAEPPDDMYRVAATTSGLWAELCDGGADRRNRLARTRPGQAGNGNLVNGMSAGG